MVGSKLIGMFPGVGFRRDSPRLSRTKSVSCVTGVKSGTVNVRVGPVATDTGFNDCSLARQVGIDFRSFGRQCNNGIFVMFDLSKRVTGGRIVNRVRSRVSQLSG